ncbi:pyridoxal-phosphate-dependent aminotransferase family protein [Caldanaerobius polysaccharolyticus]|uniref:pyridoxal-phosphate-dependent aminotransferase family protein n=1 Tax=Caldanaerobius polysaccharolyticus TaxID=44256 RepID=UPI00047A6FA1|nr:alanine--glyoxylate aminotransferase family protein [Caldanaerobius polysaccharolyticus]
MHEKLLMTPGPTMVPERVLKAMAKQPVHHRTPDFGEIFKSMNRKLQEVFETKNYVLTFPASGTGGMEAAVANVFKPGDKVLAVSIGVFGDRFAQIAKRFGVDVDILSYQWGYAASPDDVAQRLKSSKYKGLLITHNETSTGVINDIEAICKRVREADKDVLIVVDAVSSAGGVPVRVDANDIDVMVTASQKALMAPPGLAFVTVSERAWKAMESDGVSYYWDFKAAKKGLQKAIPDTPYTPAISLIVAQNEALSMILEEGLENVFLRHQNIAHATRAALVSLGFELFPQESISSPLITAVKAPQGFDVARFLALVDQRGVVLTGGQKHLKGQIFRIGHMGYINKDFLMRAFEAIEGAMVDMGYGVEKGASIKVLNEILN